MQNNHTEKFWNIPNTITLIRIFSIPIVVLLLFFSSNFIFLAVVFAVMAFSDMLDGMLARKLNQTTKIGAILDQTADRLFFTGVILSLIIKILSNSQFNIDIAYIPILLSREIIAFPAVLYLFATKKEFVKVRFIGKMTTFSQAVSITGLILSLDYPSIFLIGSTIAIYVTGFFGVISGLTYWHDVAYAKKIRRVENLKNKLEEIENIKDRVKYKIKNFRHQKIKQS